MASCSNASRPVMLSQAHDTHDMIHMIHMIQCSWAQVSSDNSVVIVLCIIVLLHFWIVNDRHFLGPKEQELLAEAAEANASYFDIFFGLSIHLPLFCHRSKISRCFGFDMNVTATSHWRWQWVCDAWSPEAACQCFARQNAGERRKKQKWSGSDWSVGQVSDFLGVDIECTE